MAFLVKNSNAQRRVGPFVNNESVLAQRIQVSRNTLALPQTTTEQLFRVKGGRVLVQGLLGQATTVFAATDPQLSINSSKLSAANVLVGTTKVIALTVDSKDLEVGGFLWVEGDGTALILSNAGAVVGAMANRGEWIAPQGEIYLTAGDSQTGAMKWDLWYLPLDPGAFVEAVNVAVAAIT